MVGALKFSCNSFNPSTSVIIDILLWSEFIHVVALFVISFGLCATIFCEAIICLKCQKRESNIQQEGERLKETTFSKLKKN